MPAIHPCPIFPISNPTHTSMRCLAHKVLYEDQTWRQTQTKPPKSGQSTPKGRGGARQQNLEFLYFM